MTKKYSLHDLSVEITRRCNKNCLHCMKGDAQNVTITEDIIDRVIADIPDVARLSLVGGEPLLELDKIAYLLEQVAGCPWGIRIVEMTTNGTICDRRIVDIFESFCMKKPGCAAVLRISNDSFHDANEYESAYAYYRPLVDEANARLNAQGLKAGIHLFYACRKDTQYSMVYSGRAVEHIDSGKAQYQHGVNVRYPTNLKHRIKILGDIIPCSLCVAANGNVCLHEEVSYTIMDEKMSIGNILDSSFSEMVDTHNFNCLLLCSETDTFVLEEAAKRDEKQFRVVNYLRFRNILCRRVLGLREKAHREFPNVPAQSIISQLQFPTDEEVREIALWIWDNDFPHDISDEVANFATTIDEHIDTPEEAMYLDCVYQLIMTWWEIYDGAITMPPHYLEQEKRQFWGIEFDNEFYDNPVCLPWNENYECNANPDGSIDYSTKLSMSANGDYERAMYQDTIDNILATVLLLEDESP